MAEPAAVFDWKKACQGKLHLKYCDMEGETANEATETTTGAIEKYMKGDQLDCAAASKAIKDYMDKTLGPYWNCIIGEGFSFEISVQRKNSMLMYYAGVYAVLLWKI